MPHTPTSLGEDARDFGKGRGFLAGPWVSCIGSIGRRLESVPDLWASSNTSRLPRLGVCFCSTTKKKKKKKTTKEEQKNETEV